MLSNIYLIIFTCHPFLCGWLACFLGIAWAKKFGYVVFTACAYAHE